MFTDLQCYEEGVLIQSKSGKNLLQDLENFIYYKDKNSMKSGREIWKCKFYNKQLCRARVKTLMSTQTNQPIIVERIGFHNHLA